LTEKLRNAAQKQVIVLSHEKEWLSTLIGTANDHLKRILRTDGAT